MNNINTKIMQSSLQMDVREITLYACKNTRKNAKSEYKTFRILPTQEGLKKEFTSNDLVEVESWLKAMKEKDLNYYRLVVFKNTHNLYNWNSGYFASWESAKLKAKIFMQLFNSENK